MVFLSSFNAVISFLFSKKNSNFSVGGPYTCKEKPLWKGIKTSVTSSLENKLSMNENAYVETLFHKNTNRNNYLNNNNQCFSHRKHIIFSF